MVAKKIYSVWKDLEESYNKMGEGVTRKDFLLSLIGYKSGNTKIEKIKELLLKDYTGNENICDLMFSVLDCLSVNLETIVGMTEEIADLDRFVGEMVGNYRTPATTIFREFDLNSLNPLRKKDCYVSLEDLASEFMMIGDCYFIVEGKALSYLVSEEEDIIFLKSGTLSRFMLKCGEGDPFYMKCSSVLKYLIQQEYNLDRPITFIGDRHYAVVGKRVSMAFKNKTLPLELKETAQLSDGTPIYITTFNNIHKSSLVVCV